MLLNRVRRGSVFCHLIKNKHHADFSTSLESWHLGLVLPPLLLWATLLLLLLLSQATLQVNPVNTRSVERALKDISCFRLDLEKSLLFYFPFYLKLTGAYIRAGQHDKLCCSTIHFFLLRCFPFKCKWSWNVVFKFVLIGVPGSHAAYRKMTNNWSSCFFCNSIMSNNRFKNNSKSYRYTLRMEAYVLPPMSWFLGVVSNFWSPEQNELLLQKKSSTYTGTQVEYFLPQAYFFSPL